jgi:hypothetical protein
LEDEEMTGWNLPPGCTTDDIERAMGVDEPRCQKCGKETDDLEREWVRGQPLWLCGDCSVAYERSVEDER